MNVELTIQAMFDSFPALFKERADCLNQLFCTIGNGYYWHKGELIYPEDKYLDKNSLKSRLVNGKAFQHNKLSLQAESRLYEEERINNGWYDDFSDRHPDEDAEQLKAMRQKTINRLPDNIYYREPERKKRWSFYVNIPGHEHIDFSEKYAYLFNYPADIKPDWKAALEECRQMLIEDGYDLPEHRGD